jgi:hypothetical protein
LNDDKDEDRWVPCTKDYVLGYHEHLVKQIEPSSGTSLFRILSAEDHLINEPCGCPLSECDIAVVRDLIDDYNHLIFDFDTHQLAVEDLSDEAPSHSHYNYFLKNVFKTLRNLVLRKNAISYYRVNIEKLVKERNKRI